MSHSETRDGMFIEWDVPIEMDDGIVLRADIYRPTKNGKYPAILTYGPYAKGKSFQESRPFAWNHMVKAHPYILEESSNKYQSWEVIDPELWVPDGYAVIRIDSRGMGSSPGFVDPYCARETKDMYDCIEWTGTRSWCTGKVGTCGISYFATNAWLVAGAQPPHLAAIVTWEGAADRYRDSTFNGGIFSQGHINWYPRAIFPIQYGAGESGGRSVVTGELVCGPELLPEEVRVKNRVDLLADDLAHPLVDEYHRERSADWSKVKVPFLSAGNWGGQANHLRGNTEGFMCAASTQKWLEIHGDSHWTEFYTHYGVDLQKRFLGYFLKGDDNGWDKQPPVQLKIRHPREHFVVRHEDAWPIHRTQWTKFYLSPDDKTLTTTEPKAQTTLEYRALDEEITFFTPPLEVPLEITGPAAAKLTVSSPTKDADIFLVIRLFAPNGEEMVFQGAQDPHTAVGHGWLRASHRKLDPKLSLPYRPYHPHDEIWPLTPNEPVDLDVEIWPTCVVVPVGYRLAVTIRGSDYRYSGSPVEIKGLPYPLTGVGAFFHEEPQDRPPEIFHQFARLHFAPGKQPYVLLPVIPSAGG
jgi:predicted acyl esterase